MTGVDGAAHRATGEAARVGAVVTWFHPDGDAVDALRATLRQCAAVVVVDNTPAAEVDPDITAPAGAHWMRQGVNLGLAGALNRGVAALPGDVDAVLLLDQDSVLPDGLVDALRRHLAAPDVGAVGPAPYDAQAGRHLDPRAARRPVVCEREVAITSGLLVRRAAWLDVAPLREDFFVDAVDLDLCLRLRDAGWRILQDRSVLLPHSLGATRWHRALGLRVRATHHPTWRLRSGARNGTVLVREHWRRRPRWAAEQVALLSYWLLTVVAFEPPRRQRAAAFLSGVRAGLTTATGDGVAAEEVPWVGRAD